MADIETSQRGKSPKAGKGVGRKPAPEALEPITVRIPESRAKWLRENIKPRRGGISGWVSEIVEVEMEKEGVGDSVVETGAKHECESCGSEEAYLFADYYRYTDAQCGEIVCVKCKSCGSEISHL